MYAQYGNYVHDANTVTIARYMVRQHYSPRNKRYAAEHTVELVGQLIVNDPSLTTPAQLQAAQYDKISALINAYRDNYKDFKFFHDDGTLSRHSLINADSLSGVHVVHRDWPQGNGAEYATLRTYSITLTALYDDVEAELMSYEESFQWIGNTGPQWELVDTVDGIVRVSGAPVTHQKMIQRGSAMGWDGYPLIYINSFLPTWEHQDRRQVVVSHPQRWANGWRLYPVQWVMHHSIPFYTQGVPIRR